MSFQKRLIPQIAGMLEGAIALDGIEVLKEPYCAVILQSSGEIMITCSDSPVSVGGDRLAVVHLRDCERVKAVLDTPSGMGVASAFLLRAAVDHLATEIGFLMKDQRPEITL